jgi:DNA processing protein
VLTGLDEAARVAWRTYEARMRDSAGARGARAAAGTDLPLPDRLLGALGGAPRALEALARAAGAPVGQTSAALLALELAGRVERCPGDRYRRRPR